MRDILVKLLEGQDKERMLKQQEKNDLSSASCLSKTTSDLLGSGWSKAVEWHT